MNVENNFQYLEHEDSNAVVSFNNGTTFRINKFMQNLNNFFVQTQYLIDLSQKLKEVGLGTPPNQRSAWNQRC